jgi:hypothetical protein
MEDHPVQKFASSFYDYDSITCVETIIETLNVLQQPLTNDSIDSENSMENSCSIVAKAKRRGRWRTQDSKDCHAVTTFLDRKFSSFQQANILCESITTWEHLGLKSSYNT